MSQVRPITVRAIGVALALGALSMAAIAPAAAGDLAGPVYGPAPYPAPNYAPMYERGGPCRIVLDRRIDPYGREVMHRMRVCDEGPVYPSAEGPVAAPGYGYPPPRFYEPQPSGYDPYPPRPPAPVGPGYYN